MSGFLNKPQVFFNCTEIPQEYLESIDLIAVAGDTRLLTLIANKRLTDLEYRGKYANRMAPLTVSLITTTDGVKSRQRYADAVMGVQKTLLHKGKPAWEYAVILDRRNILRRCLV